LIPRETNRMYLCSCFVDWQETCTSAAWNYHFIISCRVYTTYN